MNEEIQLEFLKDLLKDICSNNDILYEDISSIKDHVILTMDMVFDNINMEIVNYNLMKLLKFSYEYNNDYSGKVIYNRENVIVPDSFKDIVNHVDFIANIPQPEQRTQEWFDMRKGMITASCAAQAIGENPYSGQKTR